ncbi:hypothetical protein EUTSA_v10004760mg [Eutrema salsugineum]|uniref:Sulfotransferase n=1 Tax=Eutrema salsugineum TaxID=72664 RepID=V4KSH6_EUTSA|nr:hypothetical protein EUTSA_v10004760mg [Eutrema salsugineum]
MDASQEPHLPNYMKDDKVSQETKNLISSLPSDKDFMGYSLYNYKGCWYYPKGGTTRLKSLVFAVVHREKYCENPQIHHLLSRNPHDLVPFLELELYASNQTPDLTKFPSPTIFSTHMHLNALREATTKSSSSPCKIVYVCRGIKDTFVSGWHYRNMLHRTKMDQATFELIYWKGSLEDKENVLFMRYEEIIEEPRVQEEEKSGWVEEILKLCSLRNLSNLEVNKKGTTRLGIDSNVFFRKGEVGDWKNHLTPHMAKTIDEIVESRLRGSGLIFQ